MQGARPTRRDRSAQQNALIKPDILFSYHHGHNYRGRFYPVGEDIAPATLRNDKSETLLLVPVLNLANGFAS